MSFIFTQCAAVLFDGTPPLEEVGKALESWSIAGPQQAAPGDDGWVASGPGFVLALARGGSVVVDLVDRPWPDVPRSADPALLAAWRGGIFGPSASPGALARAREQSWSWAGGAAAADRHRAFVRLRTWVALSRDGALPKGHDPAHELTTLGELAGDLLRLPGAIAFFLSGGEALRSREQVEAVQRRKAGLGPPPLELWTNTRAMGLGEHGGLRWVLIDVVGMGQLRLPDQEALFAENTEDAEAVAPLLHNVCLHLLGGQGLGPGSTADDARGRRWKASSATGLLAPGRPVMRWLPESAPPPGEAVLAALEKLRQG
jgi:Domain of unknown function (DUF4261)